jgi:hypothetical protein
MASRHCIRPWTRRLRSPDRSQPYIEQHNNTTEGYTWTAKAADILDKVRRAKVILDRRPFLSESLLKCWDK